jgi:hypothetical protein
MTSDYVQIERLQAEIGLKRSALAEHQAALAKLQREIGTFANQYERVVGPLEAQLDAVRQQIEAMQASQSDEPPFDPTSIWGGYQSIEESFDAKYRQPQNPTIRPERRPAAESELRATYRRLARKYHPDTTTNPAEKARLTVIMAQVNAAYRAKNLDELYALEGRRPAAKPLHTPPSHPAADIHRSPTYAQLLEQSYQLDDEILMVKSEHQRLLDSPLMALKIEYSLARSQGRDLLREIAAKVRADLDAAQAELNALRRAR